MPFGDKSKDKDLPDHRQTIPIAMPEVDDGIMPVRSLSEGPDDFPDLINVDGEEEIYEAVEPEVTQDIETPQKDDPVTRPEKKTNASKSDVEKECAICHVKATSTWRRDAQGQLICNKCGLRKRKDVKPKKPKAAKAESTTEQGTGTEHEALSIFGTQNGTVQGLPGDGDQNNGNLSDTITPVKPPRKPRKSLNPSGTPKSCFVCGVEQSPAWRKDEGKSLCNRCMLRKKRAIESTVSGRKYTPRAKAIVPVQRDMPSPSPAQASETVPTPAPTPKPAEMPNQSGNIPIDPQLMHSIESSHDHDQPTKRQKLEDDLNESDNVAMQMTMPDDDVMNQPMDDLSQFELPPELSNSNASPFRPPMPNFT